jgi:hypothetical protein
MRILPILLIFATSAVHAQKYTVEKGSIIFFSKATLEDIKAENQKVVSLFNSETGAIAFSVPIVEFQFEKSLMQEHFNEKYLESDKFPKATFQGTLANVQMNSAEEQVVKATGKLTIHGVTKEVAFPGTFQHKNGKVIMTSTFMIRLEDYQVAIPQLMWQNIAEEVEVSLSFIYKPQ